MTDREQYTGTLIVAGEPRHRPADIIKPFAGVSLYD